MLFKLINDNKCIHGLYYPLKIESIEYCKKVFLQDIVDEHKCKFNKTFNNEFAYIQDKMLKQIGR